MKSDALTPDAYVQELTGDRRELIAAVRAHVNEHMPAGYVEAMQYGMIAWQVPLSRYHAASNGQPLSYVALASQKNNAALYLMAVSAREDDFRARWKKAGKKLDMGKSCLRFHRLDDLALDVLGEQIASLPVDDLIALTDKTRTKAGAAAKRPTAKKAATRAPKAKQPARRR
jgi:hypothetical protein